MKKTLKKIIQTDVKQYVLLCILFASLIFTFTVYKGSLTRTLSALEDLCTSFLYWFFFGYGQLYEVIFGIDLPNVRATFLEFPRISVSDILNVDLTGLSLKLKSFPVVFISSFVDYNVLLFNVLFWVILLGGNVFIAVLLLIFAIYLMMISENGKPVGYVSKPARAYMSFTEKVIKPVKSFYLELTDYAEKHTALTYLIIAVWLLNFNVLSIGAELLAFFLYFTCTYSIKALGLVFAYVCADVVLLLLSMPFALFVAVSLRIYYRTRYERGVDELKHMEAKNCGYLKTLDIIALITGEPGTGKTTLLVDMFLSWINIFKDESLGTLFKYELYFSRFPWAKLRADVARRVATGELYCQPAIENYIDIAMDFYEVTGDDGFIYGYRADIYPTEVDMGNRKLTLREALKTYSKAFALYINENLGISNLSIRMDGNFDDSKYFKKWNGNFFERKKVSRYSHILNQDMLRHGVRMDPASAEIGAFGPSVIGWTEISKDLGNQNTNASYRADSVNCNPKNEKTIHSFMFARHAKTLVDNFPYIRIITDDQRVSNIAAGAVGLMCTVNILECSETMYAIEGFDWLFALEGFVSKCFKKLNEKRENVRGDITLSWLLIKQAVSALKMPAVRMKQQFGYEELTLLKQAGNAFSGNEGAQNAAGQATTHTYYKMYWKVYSDRFLSDTHSSAYAGAQLRNGIGIDGIPTYEDIRMSVDELVYQRSRLGTELVNMTMENSTNVKAQNNFDEIMELKK